MTLQDCFDVAGFGSHGTGRSSDVGMTRQRLLVTSRLGDLAGQYDSE